MALMSCPECGREISDAARKCPNCGYALKKFNTKKLLAILGAVVLVVAAVAGAYYFFVYTPQQIPVKATELLEQGDYVGADALYARLGKDEENLKLREQLFYESRILSAAKAVQDTLIFPDSMMISEVVIWAEEIENTEAKTDVQQVYVATEPEILLHYLAKSKGGSMVDGYVRVNWENGKYEVGRSVPDLESSDKLPWYIDEDDAEEALEFWLDNGAKIRIVIDLYERIRIGSFDLERCNDMLVKTFGKQVTMIPAGDLIVTPTPRIVQLTPAPTEAGN